MSRVDVIVPCYRYGHFLRECVGSVLAQDGVEVRVLILDDASPDDSAEVAAALAAQNGRVEVRSHATNQGHIATYNEGLGWATGDYLLLLSADDVLTPDALPRAAALMDQHPEVGFTFGRAITTDRPDFANHPGAAQYRHKVLTGAEFWERSCAEATNFVPTPTMVVRTALQHRVGGYREELSHTGDLEMCLRLAAHAPVGVLEADQAFYRIHGRNMHKETFTEALEVLEQHRLAFEILFREHGDRFAGRERLERMAARALALAAVRRAGRALERGDRPSCERLMAEAVRVFPEVPREREWSRLRWKLLLGRWLWLRARGLLRLVRIPAPVDPSPFGRSGVFEGV
jgi:glycosyltransferase involved in cell wall biosynthesis